MEEATTNGNGNGHESEKNGQESKGERTKELLTPSEVAAMFSVDPKTVTRWAKAGKLTAFRTLGGHRRYQEAEVRTRLGEMKAAG